MKFDVGDIVAWEHSDTAEPFIALITSLNKGLSIDNDPMYWLIVGISVDVDMVSCRPATKYKLSLLNTMGERGREEGDITITYSTLFVETHYERVSE